MNLLQLSVTVQWFVGDFSTSLEMTVENIQEPSRIVQTPTANADDICPVPFFCISNN